MQNQTAPRSHRVPASFYIKFGQYVTAVLRGFYPIRFRATLRMLYRPSMMDRYLGYCGVKLEDFKTFAESTTAKVKAAAYRAGALAGRPLEYLGNPGIAKDELAREVVQRHKIKEGLIAIFSAVEPCLSYSVRGDRQTKQIKLVLEARKCTHFYHYYTTYISSLAWPTCACRVGFLLALMSVSMAVSGWPGKWIVLVSAMRNATTV